VCHLAVKNAQIGHFGLFFGLQMATTEPCETQFLSVEKLLARRVPASESETGKRFAKRFRN
jgi:hypothetical protein